MKLLTFLALILFLHCSYGQIIHTASAIISFDSNLKEELSGVEPEANGSYLFIHDRNGNENRAISLMTELDYGNPVFSKMDTTDFTIAFWFRKDGSLWQEKPVILKEYINFDSLEFESYGFVYNDWIGEGSMLINFKPETNGDELRAGMEALIWMRMTS